MNTKLTTWNDTTTVQAILEFVEAVTKPGSPNFIPRDERIAVFDNDGTLWCEKPMYIQFDYFLQEIAKVAKGNPELRSKQPWKAAWEKDFGWFGEAVTKHYQGDDSDFRIFLDGILALAKDRPVRQIEAAAKDFIERHRHPTMGIPYRECVYQPMLELLRYLEANGFTNYIVSGGGRDFMRGFSEELYGIPRQRVIGSTVAYRCVEKDTGIEIVQKPELDVIDDGPGKALQIWNIIGRCPILAAGNSNGDIEMLKFTESNRNKSLNLLLLHDDNQREYAYTRGAEKALSLADDLNWQIIHMQNDWRAIFSHPNGVQ